MKRKTQRDHTESLSYKAMPDVDRWDKSNDPPCSWDKESSLSILKSKKVLKKPTIIKSMSNRSGVN